MKQLQELMDAIGKKRFILLVVLVLINAAMVAIWQKNLLPQQDQLSMDATTVQSERSKLQTDIRELPIKHAALEKNEKRYDELEAHGVFETQDRIKARGHMDVLRQEAGLRGIDYKIDPQKTVDTPTLSPTEKEVVMSDMTVDMRGLTDHEMLRFLDKMQESFKGLVVLKKFTISRKSEVNDMNLNSLKNGEPVDFVISTANFEWYSITPKAVKSDSPMAQAFQGSTP